MCNDPMTEKAFDDEPGCSIIGLAPLTIYLGFIRFGYRLSLGFVMLSEERRAEKQSDNLADWVLAGTANCSLK
ncbi:hypothetical protein D0Y65_000650 [Glycine soja]|uniref:Uncharacterized protein n=1 Tax=Glycine soja TaxID=3848 RepID=A0A445LZN5_GLYSO|nr:hypothetical protein D0Y65_000650 [Glycine soja]